MATTRTITIASTRGVTTPITTSAQYLQDIMSDLQSRGINLNENKLIIKETRAEINRPDAVLPEGDFSLFIYPKKVKSGGLEDDLKSLNQKVDRILNMLASQPVATVEEKKQTEEELQLMNEYKALADGYVFDDEDEDEDDDWA